MLTRRVISILVRVVSASAWTDDDDPRLAVVAMLAAYGVLVIACCILYLFGSALGLASSQGVTLVLQWLATFAALGCAVQTVRATALFWFGRRRAYGEWQLQAGIRRALSRPQDAELVLQAAIALVITMALG